jgi:holo-[acyl-carrier protein] synthase
MITGIGIDIIEVARISESVDRDTGFKTLVFSGYEISYCESKAAKFEHYAARFAAKEAFLKALGTGWADELELNEIEIRNAENGRPTLHLLGKTAESVGALNITSISVSLSHIKTMATAIVILEK